MLAPCASSEVIDDEVVLEEEEVEEGRELWVQTCV